MKKFGNNEVEKITKHIPLLCLGGARGGSISNKKKLFIKMFLNNF